MITRTLRSRHGRARTPALAVACAVVIITALTAGCGGRVGDDKKPEHRSFSLQGKTLTIDSDDSALELVPVDGDEVRVTRWFKGRTVLGDAPSVSWAWRDDRLTLRMSCSGMVTGCTSRHRIEIPRTAAVTVNNEDGSVTANDFRTALKIHTEDGAIRVERSAGRLELTAADASIRTVHTTSRQVKATTADGTIELELAAVPNRIETRTQDGTTTLRLPRSGPNGATIAYHVDVSTEDGLTDIAVPQDAESPHVISARADDGKVTVQNTN